MIRIMKPWKTIRYEFVCTECVCEYIEDLADVRKLYFGAQEEVACNCPSCDIMNLGNQIKPELSEFCAVLLRSHDRVLERIW